MPSVLQPTNLLNVHSQVCCLTIAALPPFLSKISILSYCLTWVAAKCQTSETFMDPCNTWASPSSSRLWLPRGRFADFFPVTLDVTSRPLQQFLASPFPFLSTFDHLVSALNSKEWTVSGKHTLRIFIRQTRNILQEALRKRLLCRRTSFSRELV